MERSSTRHQTSKTNWGQVMNELSVDSTRAFLDRFYDGHDGVIRSVQAIFRYRSNAESKVTVTISLRDSQAKGEGWVNLVLEMVNAKEWVFVEGNVTYQVIFEMHIGYYEGMFFIDFGGLSEQPTSASDFKQSGFYCASRRVSWEIKPYEES